MLRSFSAFQDFQLEVLRESSWYKFSELLKQQTPGKNTNPPQICAWQNLKSGGGGWQGQEQSLSRDVFIVSLRTNGIVFILHFSSLIDHPKLFQSHSSIHARVHIAHLYTACFLSHIMHTVLYTYGRQRQYRFLEVSPCRAAILGNGQCWLFLPHTTEFVVYCMSWRTCWHAEFVRWVLPLKKLFVQKLSCHMTHMSPAFFCTNQSLAKFEFEF